MLSKYFKKLLKLPAELLKRRNPQELGGLATAQFSTVKKKSVIVKKRNTIMDNVTNVRYGPLPADSPYVRPFRLYYEQNGQEKSWDILKVHDSVSIILFNKTRQTLVFVKQFRPAVYHSMISTDDNLEPDVSKASASDAITLELCAGIVDKSIPTVEIAREEVLEECGYNVTADRLEEVMRYRAGVGTNGSHQTMYYCEVTDADKVASGGGVGDEMIEVVEYSLSQARDLVKEGTTNNSPPSFLFGVLWFLTSRAPKSD